MERESFSSRLGFILISAGCAIGLGNVWRFPFVTGQYGGASFVLIYLCFLLLLGLPIMVAEFAVGRASRRSPAKSFDTLEPKGTKWHLFKYVTIAGNIILMMFYTTIAGWLLLGQVLNNRELWGCILMFAAIILSQLPAAFWQSLPLGMRKQSKE